MGAPDTFAAARNRIAPDVNRGNQIIGALLLSAASGRARVAGATGG